jgi:hypothetical protein
MPNRTTSDETDKLDHSTHPTTHATKDDLKAPGGGTTGAKPEDKLIKKSEPPKESGAG